VAAAISPTRDSCTSRPNRQGRPRSRFIAVVGGDPEAEDDFGRILNRFDMPQQGDRVFTLRLQPRAEPADGAGLFSGTIQVLEISACAAPDDHPSPQRSFATAATSSAHRHRPGEQRHHLVSMIGANSPSTGPAAWSELNSFTGEFQNRESDRRRPVRNDSAPSMYEQHSTGTEPHGHHGVRWPGNVAPESPSRASATPSSLDWQTKTVLSRP